MRIRELKSADIPLVERLHANSKLRYSIPSLYGNNILDAQCMVDEEDRPRMILVAERVAELYLVLDAGWQTPAFRAVAITELHQKVRENLEVEGIQSAYAFLGDDVPKGYDRRLYRLGGALMDVRCMKFESNKKDSLEGGIVTSADTMESKASF